MSGVVVWRLCHVRFAQVAFNGEGARLYGGRWSPVGIPVVYTAESRALAVVEVLVNAHDPQLIAGMEWVVISAEVPASAIEQPARFPERWREYPHSRDTQAVGESWAREARSLALRVPSVVVPGEFNYLLNPAHPGMKTVQIGRPTPFQFDPRLGSPR